MNDLITKYKTKMTCEVMKHYNDLIACAELDHEDLKDKSYECNLDTALEKVMKYGTYEDCVKAIKSYVIFTQLRVLLEILV